MTESQLEILRTIIWSVVAVFGIFAGTMYAMVSLLVTHRRMFERRVEPGRTVGYIKEADRG